MKNIKDDINKYMIFFVVGCFLFIGSITMVKHSTTPSVITIAKKIGDESSPDDRFEKAMKIIFKDEGGYSNDPHDPGGETKYGISKISYPKIDIKNLTAEDARTIYKRDYYLPMGCDQYSDDDVALEIMEEAVNIGTQEVTYFIQAIVYAHGEKMDIDGKLGKKTIQAVNRMPSVLFLNCIKSLAISHYFNLAKKNPLEKRYLKGWFDRVMS